MSLNFTLDVDVGKERKRLQCSDKRACQGSLREWGLGPRLCESLLLTPVEAEVSGGLQECVCKGGWSREGVGVGSALLKKGRKQTHTCKSDKSKSIDTGSWQELIMPEIENFSPGGRR